MSKGGFVQEKGKCDYEKRRLQGEGKCRSEGRRFHSQSQLPSPGLWDTVKETEGKGRKKQGKSNNLENKFKQEEDAAMQLALSLFCNCTR